MAKSKYRINIDEDEFLPVYRHTIGSQMDIEFLYGSRDSGKSRHIAQILLTLCLAMPKFKCPLIRKVANTVKDSQWSTLKEVAEEWKIDHLFQFTTHPLEIRCVSGGVFLARGCDDPLKLKSLTNPSHAWIEEGVDLDETDWTIITTSLRSNYYRAQIWFSFNPDVPGLYQEFWLYKRYFAKHEDELSFTETITEKLDDGTEASITYRATHSTFYDNPYCPPERKAIYMGLKAASEYSYLVYAMGRWGIRKKGGEFLKGLKFNVHIKSHKILTYNPGTTIHISLDSNVYPYIAITVWQLVKEDEIWKIRQIAELPAEDPENTASQAAKKVVKYLQNIAYNKKIFLYGDRSTKNRNNIDDDKRSFFQIFQETLQNAYFKTEDRFLSYAPAVSSIGDFINAIFTQEVTFGQIEISDACPKSINDYIFTKTDKDGGILKVKVKEKDTGLTYEKNGHLTDTLKDFIVQAFFQEFKDYCSRNSRVKPGGVKQIDRKPRVTL